MPSKKPSQMESWTLDAADWPLIINEGDRVVALISLPANSTGDDAAGLQALADANLIITAVNYWQRAPYVGQNTTLPSRED